MKSKQSNSKNPLLVFTISFSNLGDQEDLSMDWSPEIPLNTSPPPYISSAGVHIPLPHVSLPQSSIHSNNMFVPINTDTVILNYSNNQLSVSDLWDGDFHVLSIFESKETLNIDVTNITTFLKRIKNHIKNHPVDKTVPYRKFTVITKGL